MNEIELKKLLTELYKTAEKIGEVGIHDVISSDYVRMWVNDEKKVLKMFKAQQTKLDKAVEALEACQKFGAVDATDSFKFETLLKQTLLEIKESK